MPFYKNDLKLFYLERAAGDPSAVDISGPRRIIVIAHGVLIGVFGILFFLCALSSVIVGTYLRVESVLTSFRIDKGTAIQGRLLSLLHLLWGAALLALCVLGLLDVEWRGEFLGGDLLWMAVLFATTGILTSNSYRTLVNMRLAMNVVCLGIAVEKLCASINLIYQFSSYDIYVMGENRTFVAQIILISVQTAQAQINAANQQFLVTPQQSTINEVAIIIAAGATLACVIATLCGTIYSLLKSPYLLHYHSISPDSTVVAPLGDEGGFARGASQHSSRRIGAVTGQQGPVSCEVPIQQMEEQTVYWSARENPFYYHTSKRFYGQPYQVESGFYGYTLSNPPAAQQRMYQSSSSQTQIAHIFTDPYQPYPRV
ncbi:hypothetical protein Y032_0039g127 [Ancylostoma ceylanicum]|uniref:Uncharacterized protein n=1 Tax=Ancylostoma ceylanicum TaxID=53326 RepID=A0A016UIL9_9BILA|nr:hypothetical protein Y032_0039g127 [Ancylostoma ceylanicum]